MIYKIKRFSMIHLDEVMFADLKAARDKLNENKYVFFNHLVLYLLLEEWREDCEDGLTWHWYKDLGVHMSNLLAHYDNKTIKNNLDFIKLFEGFIDKSDNRYEYELRKKLNRENSKIDAYRKITYPTQFLNSSEFKSILTYLSDYWNSWVKRSGKPKLDKDDNYKDCQSFIGDPLFEVKTKYRLVLNKYIDIYIK